MKMAMAGVASGGVGWGSSDSSPGDSGVYSGAVEVWAFDFDGVLCDSVRETGMAAWKTCKTLFGSADLSTVQMQALLRDFAVVSQLICPWVVQYHWC